MFRHCVPTYATPFHLLKITRKLPPLPADIRLCTIYITFLYTNIPHAHDLATLEFFLNQRLKHHSTTTAFPLNLVNLVFTWNNFTSDNKHYLQIRGTVMGTRMAPCYANLFMGKLEHDFLQTQSLTPLLWIRYLDDTLMLYSHGETSLKTFLEQLNQVPVVQFTWSIYNERVTFLDVDITLWNNTLNTSVHIKPTNHLQYLHYSSFNPYHIKKTIPFSLAVRGQRLNSTTSSTEIYNQRLQEALVNRGSA